MDQTLEKPSVYSQGHLREQLKRTTEANFTVQFKAAPAYVVNHTGKNTQKDTFSLIVSFVKLWV